MFDEILIPTDGSDGAERAARHGLAIARATDARVHILSVVDSRTYGDVLDDLDATVRDAREQLEDQAEEAVRAIGALATDGGELVDAIETGVPHDAILDYVTDRGIDLVVMGTRGRSGFERALVGSVAERVLRRCPAPVLTVGPEAGERQAGEYDTVLVPTDGSDAAAVAVPAAIELARYFDATVHAVSAVDVTGLSGFDTTGYVFEDVVGSLEDDAKRAVSQVAERVSAAGLEAVTEVIIGSPHRAIMDSVEEHNIDLIAMGTHGRTGLDRYLLGSVAERIVRSSLVPVLTVRPPDDF